jgi:hypothetical protein
MLQQVGSRVVMSPTKEDQHMFDHSPLRKSNSDTQNNWLHNLNRGDVLRLPMTVEEPIWPPQWFPWVFTDYVVHQRDKYLEFAPGFFLHRISGPDCITVESKEDRECVGLGMSIRFDLSQRRLLSISDPMFRTERLQTSSVTGCLPPAHATEMNAIRARHRA